ncbi:hypothetical protein B5S28_g3807 [[Candida] boidinii]|nr:hypothetical protein B5S28_g3807 [[Candida] boidinii]OWB64155.1 hypothetical protein B5S29_g5201 [[Candida] boidinii]OWB74755.1 hypothetical protein B5S31_g4574 [[Candida] boidinii]OWB80370.1 hypothetical protein B5S32_g4639 [[Candida] boidinii]GME92323.1 unnamed protein product [[Candida] boidinii]
MVPLNLNRILISVLILLTFISVVIADMDMNEQEGGEEHMDHSSHNPKLKLEPYMHAGSKSFHWICSIIFLMLIPSIGTALSFANKYVLSISVQIICAIYAVIDVLFLRFNDMNDHENRTSRGTAWFLGFFYCILLFFGSIASSSNLYFNEDGEGSTNNNNNIQKKFHWITILGKNTIGLIYKILSLLIVICGFIRCSLAPVALLGFCYDSHTGQCNAHGIMGFSFIIYGFVYSLVLVIPWLRRGDGSQYTQDFYDSIIMTLWGIVNTFTEHRWGREGWSMGDYQHTSMGIVWWAGGCLGIYLSRNGKRTFIPSLLLIFTGYSMFEHTQLLLISTKVHSMFGIVLMFGGFFRIIEISFILNDEKCDKSNDKIFSFQYLPALALIESGILFMGANEEQMQLIHDLGADHSSYILVLTSASFLIFLWFLMILEFYLKLLGYTSSGNGSGRRLNLRDYESLSNGQQQYQQEGPVTEFELDDLSDNEIQHN